MSNISIPQATPVVQIQKARGVYISSSGRDAANLLATINQISKTVNDPARRDKQIKAATVEVANKNREDTNVMSKVLVGIFNDLNQKNTSFNGGKKFVDFVYEVTDSNKRDPFLSGLGVNGKAVLEALANNQNYRKSRDGILELLRLLAPTLDAEEKPAQPDPFQSEAKSPRGRSGSFGTEADIQDLRNSNHDGSNQQHDIPGVPGFLYESQYSINDEKPNQDNKKAPSLDHYMTDEARQFKAQVEQTKLNTSITLAENDKTNAENATTKSFANQFFSTQLWSNSKISNQRASHAMHNTIQNNIHIQNAKHNKQILEAAQAHQRKMVEAEANSEAALVNEYNFSS